VQKAIRDGVIVRQPCEVCGAEPAHGHHDDYDKPLELRWLCPTHHKALHPASNKTKGRTRLPMTPSPPGFPTRLRKLRLKLGYTQKGLAEIAGVHYRTIGFWESGRHQPNPGDPIIKTAVALRTSVSYLLTGRTR
jgi:DNA-binding XRE family transcriptional regulator